MPLSTTSRHVTVIIDEDGYIVDIRASLYKFDYEYELFWGELRSLTDEQNKALLSLLGIKIFDYNSIDGFTYFKVMNKLTWREYFEAFYKAFGKRSRLDPLSS